MTFQFRRRGDVRDQASQEPFFQSADQQHGFVDQAPPYPPMGQHPQGYDQRVDARFGPQQQYSGQMPGGQPNASGRQQPPQYFQESPGNFYGANPAQQSPHYEPQQVQNPYAGQAYGLAQPKVGGQPQFSPIDEQAAYTHPIRASQIPQGQMPQQPVSSPQNFPKYPNVNQGFSQQPQATPMHYGPEDIRSLSFMQGQNANAGFETTDNESDSSPVRLLVAISGIALIAGLSWFAYKWAKSPSSDTPPLIHAEAGPHKISPDHRGGINIPYQDKLIYERIGDEQHVQGPTERLLPPPERPAVIENQDNRTAQQRQEQLRQEQFQEPIYREAPNEVSVSQNQRGYAEPNNQQIQRNPDGQNQVQQPRDLQAELPISETDGQPPRKIKATPTITGKYFVQLATVKSEVTALNEWKRVRAKYNLKGIKSQIKESETTDGETVYRLLMGPFSEKVEALKYAVKMDGTKVVLITE